MQTTANMPTALPGLVGQFKTFGSAGPAYEVLASVRPLRQNDWLMQVRVLESGEELELPASQINQDPRAI
jgi:hypothetical protein